MTQAITPTTPQPPPTFPFDPNFALMGPTSEPVIEEPTSTKKAHTTRYLSVPVSLSYPLPRPGEWVCVDVTGPSVLKIIEASDASAPVAGAEYYETWCSPNETPDDGFQAIRGHHGRLLIPARGRYWIAISSAEAHNVNVAIFDVPYPELADAFLNPPVNAHAGYSLQVIAAATDTVLVDIGLVPTTRRVEIYNTGANPAFVTLGEPATATRGIPLAAGGSVILDGNNYPCRSVHIRSTLGTSINWSFSK